MVLSHSSRPSCYNKHLLLLPKYISPRLSYVRFSTKPMLPCHFGDKEPFSLGGDIDPQTLTCDGLRCMCGHKDCGDVRISHLDPSHDAVPVLISRPTGNISVACPLNYKLQIQGFMNGDLYRGFDGTLPESYGVLALSRQLYGEGLDVDIFREHVVR